MTSTTSILRLPVLLLMILHPQFNVNTFDTATSERSTSSSKITAYVSARMLPYSMSSRPSSQSAAMITSKLLQQYGQRTHPSNQFFSLNMVPRGGATLTPDDITKVATTKKATSGKKKRKKKKKKKLNAKDPSIQQQSKHLINDKLKDEDSAAKSLGDAIRQNAHLLLNHNDDDEDDDTFSTTTTTTLQSLGYALGSSDYTTSVLSQYSKATRASSTSSSSSSSSSTKSKMAQELTSPSAVIAHYFLKSHGGVHMLQCVCSLLASLAGIGSLLLYKTPMLQYTLVRRTLLFGMCKHIAGVLMAIYLVAGTMSRRGGFQEAIQSINALIRDPISQYVFYTVCVLFWLPSSTITTIVSKTTTPPAVGSTGSTVEGTMTAAVVGLVWWQQYSWIPLLLVGPVVLREFISIALVASDVLTLIIATTAGTDTPTATYIEQILKVMQALVDAGMSILVTPKKWKSSNAVQRQAVLANLVTKISLLMEIGVGMLMLCDCVVMSVSYLFVNTGGHIRFYSLIKSIICTRLYIGFLLTRRKNINKLVETIRGGAAEMPIYVLDVILHPSSSMGIDTLPSPSKLRTTTENSSPEQVQGGSHIEPTRKWLDFVRMALDMDVP